MRFPGGNIEFTEYHELARREPEPRRAREVGSCHLAFVVDDVQAAVRDLRSRGMSVVGRPSSVGGADGPTIACGLDPDGNRLELLQMAPAEQRVT